MDQGGVHRENLSKNGREVHVALGCLAPMRETPSVGDPWPVSTTRSELCNLCHVCSTANPIVHQVTAQLNRSAVGTTGLAQATFEDRAPRGSLHDALNSSGVRHCGATFHQAPKMALAKPRKLSGPSHDQLKGALRFAGKGETVQAGTGEGGLDHGLSADPSSKRPADNRSKGTEDWHGVTCFCTADFPQRC